MHYRRLQRKQRRDERAVRRLLRETGLKSLPPGVRVEMEPPPRVRDWVTAVLGFAWFVVTLCTPVLLVEHPAVGATVLNAAGGLAILSGAVLQAKRSYMEYVAQLRGTPANPDLAADPITGRPHPGPAPRYVYMTQRGWTYIFAGGAQVFAGSMVLAVLAEWPWLGRGWHWNLHLPLALELAGTAAGFALIWAVAALWDRAHRKPGPG